MVTEGLYPPALPQMANDGYINAAELESASGVVIDINGYSNAAAGDYLCLYWDNEVAATLWLTEENLDTVFPWQELIPQDLVPDGSHLVWFTATDTYQNISASGISTAFVDRSYTGTLPPPILTDAQDGIIDYQSVSYNNGTHIKIPGDALLTGETVNIYWEGFDESGSIIQASLTSLSHTVTSDDLQGFSVIIAPPYITAINQGTAQTWYSVTEPTGSTLNSDSATAIIDMTNSAQYSAPEFPEGSDGWLDCTECVDGVDIFIPASTQFVPGAMVIVYWQGYDNSGNAISGTQATLIHPLTTEDVAEGFTVTVDAAFVTPIVIGIAQASYQVTSTPGYSSLAQVRVDTEHCGLLPAPTFPAAAGDGVISGVDVESDEGTEMIVKYANMAAGDVITSFWFGYTDTPETPVPGSNWMQARTLNQDEALAQAMNFHIPATYITPIDSGNGKGWYQVMFKEGGIATSEASNVAVEMEYVSELKMLCATGAPIFDPIVAVRPLNRVSLFGPAGTSVILSLPTASDAFFNPSGKQLITVILDENGIGMAEVYALVAGNATVDAYAEDDPTLTATGGTIFTPWKAGAGELMSYGVSTGGIANGAASCAVYVQTTPNSLATEAKLVLTSGSAIILSTGSQTGYVDVAATHAAGFDISDTVVESVQFTLSLPNISSSYVTGSISFAKFA